MARPQGDWWWRVKPPRISFSRGGGGRGRSRTYTVKAGDSWARIAGNVYGDQRMFQVLANANYKIAQRGLQPGDVINLPGKQDDPYVSEGALEAYSGPLDDNIRAQWRQSGWQDPSGPSEDDLIALRDLEALYQQNRQQETIDLGDVGSMGFALSLDNLELGSQGSTLPETAPHQRPILGRPDAARDMHRTKQLEEYDAFMAQLPQMAIQINQKVRTADRQGLEYEPTDEEQLILSLYDAQRAMQQQEAGQLSAMLATLGKTGDQLPEWLSDEDRRRIEQAKAKGYETYYIQTLQGPMPVTFSAKDYNIQRLNNILGQTATEVLDQVSAGNPEWDTLLKTFMDRARMTFHEGMYQFHRDFGFHSDLQPIYRELWETQGVMRDVPSWEVKTERGVDSPHVMWVPKGAYHQWLSNYYYTTTRELWDDLDAFWNGKPLSDRPHYEFMDEAGELIEDYRYALTARVPGSSYMPQVAGMQSRVARQLWAEDLMAKGDQARQEAYSLRKRVTELITRYEETGAPDLAEEIETAYADIRNRLKEAIDIDRQVRPSLGDVYWNATWGAMPFMEEMFINNVINVEMQAGRPLTDLEIQIIKNNYVDVGLQALSEIMYDPINVVGFFGAPDLIMDGGKHVLGRTFRAMFNSMGEVSPHLGRISEALQVALKGGKIADLQIVLEWVDDLPLTAELKGRVLTQLEEIGDIRGVSGLIEARFPRVATAVDGLADGLKQTFKWLDEAGPVGALAHIRDLALNQSVKSAAQMTAKKFMTSAMKLARKAKSFDEFLDFMRVALNGGVELSPLARGGGDLATAVSEMSQRSGLPGAFGKNDWLNLSAHGGFSSVGDLATNRMKGWLDGDAVAQRARTIRSKIREVQEQGARSRLANMSAEHFTERFGMEATPENLQKVLPNYINQEITNEHVVQALADDFREALLDFNRLKFGKEPYKESLLYSIGRFIPAGIMQDETGKFISLAETATFKRTYGTLSRLGGTVRSWWVSAVLAFAPRWYLRNIMDSGFRMLVADPGAAVHDFGVMSHALLRHYPDDIVWGWFDNVWSGALDEMGLSAMRMIRTGEIENLGNFLTPWEFIKAAWARDMKSPKLSPFRVIRAMRDGGYAFNTAIEGMMRTRMLYHTFIQEFNPRHAGVVVDEINRLIELGADEGTVARARNLLLSGRDDVTYIKSAGGQISGYVELGGRQHTVHLPMERLQPLLDRVGPDQQAKFLDDMHLMFRRYEEMKFIAGEEVSVDDIIKLLDDAEAYYELQPEELRRLQELDESGTPDWSIDPDESAMPDLELDGLDDAGDPVLDAERALKKKHDELMAEYDDLSRRVYTATDDELTEISERMAQIDEELRPNEDDLANIRRILGDDEPTKFKHSSPWVESRYPEFTKQARKTAAAHRELSEQFKATRQWFIDTIGDDKDAVKKGLEAIQQIEDQYANYQRVGVIQRKLLTEVFNPSGDWGNFYYLLEMKHYEGWMNKANELSAMMESIRGGKQVQPLEPVNWKTALRWAGIEFDVDEELDAITAIRRINYDGSVTEYTDQTSLFNFREYVWRSHTRTMSPVELANSPAGLYGRELHEFLHPQSKVIEEQMRRTALLGMDEEKVNELLDAYRIADDKTIDEFKDIHEITEALDDDQREFLEQLAQKANRKNASAENVEQYRQFWKTIVADNEELQRAINKAYKERVNTSNRSFWHGVVEQMDWGKYGEASNDPEAMRKYFQNMIKAYRGEAGAEPIVKYARTQLRQLDNVENVMHQVNESIFSRYADEIRYERKPIEFDINDLWDSKQTAYWMQQRADQASLAFKQAIGEIRNEVNVIRPRPGTGRTYLATDPQSVVQYANKHANGFIYIVRRSDVPQDDLGRIIQSGAGTTTVDLPVVGKLAVGDGFMSQADLLQKAGITGNIGDFVYFGGGPLGIDLGRITDPQQADIFKGWLDGASLNVQGTVDLALHGGEGVEGALPFTQRYMLDYQDYTGLDQMIKSTVYPFWMFNSRSIALWAQVVSEKPWLATFWGRWHKYTGMQRQHAGYIDSRGRPLGKLRNAIKIPGVNMWLNPLQVLSVGFVMPFDVHERLWLDQPTGDERMIQTMTNFIYDIGNYFGLGMAPWTKWALEKGGLLDESQTFWNSVLPFTDLVPKFGDIGRFFENLHDAGMIPRAIGRQFTNPERPYEDYYVELELLLMLQEVYKSEGEESALAMVKDIQEALGYELTESGKDIAFAFMHPTEGEYNVNLRASNPDMVPYYMAPREDHPLWLQAKDRYMKNSYATTIMGFMTGFYPRVFSEEEAEIMRIRDEINALKKAINNDLGAMVFQYDISREARYANSIHQRFETTEGWINNFYNSMRYVQLPNGDLAQGTRRRELMVDQIHKDATQTAFWQSIGAAQNWLNEQLEDIPVGVDYRTTAHIYDTYFEWLNLIETSTLFAGVEQNSLAGYKPVTEIEGHLEDKFMRTLRASRPNMSNYEGDNGYSEWELDMERWKQSLPELAKIAARSFTLYVVDYLSGGGGLPAEKAKEILGGYVTTFGGVEFDIQKTIDQLVAGVTAEAYEEWEMSRHSPRRALENAWKELYWDRYWDMVEGTKGHARELAIMEFKRLYPHPTDEQLVDWVMENYKDNQFTDEILMGYLTQPSLTIDERMALKDQSPASKLVDRAWELARRVPPRAGDEIENLLASYGVDPDMWDDLWDASESLKNVRDEDDMRRLQNFVAALEKMEFSEPTPTEQMEWAAVANLNDTQKELAQLKFGDNIFDIQNLYYEAFDTMPNEYIGDTAKWKALRKEFLDVTYPQLEEYWDWRDVYAQAYPLWAKYYKPAIYKEIAVSAPPPGEARTFNSIAGETLWNEIVMLEAKGEPLSNRAVQRLETIKERYPYHGELVDTILALNRLR